MKTNHADKIREIQHGLSVGFEQDEISPQANMARLKALRLAKEASDRANGIKPVVVEGARMAKSRT
jgi:hypothetical protein